MIELAVAVALILLNGAFALSELAVVSSRKSRLRTMVEAHRPGAKAAMALADDPGRFLSTVQIGITLVGILSGAVSGAALGERLTTILFEAGLSKAVSDPLGYGLVIAAITYLSVIIGELVPKHVALRDPEGFACMVAPTMRVISRAALPAVWLLDASTRAVFRVLGQEAASASAVTEEEIRSIVAEAETAGVIETDERKMIAGVLRLGDRAVRGVMTPRTDVHWIDLDKDPAEIRAMLLASPHSRVPVGEGNPDNMLGVVQVREIVKALVENVDFDLRAYIRTAPVLPDTLDALDALTALQAAEVPMALVHDEYGHFDGLVTPADILDAIAGAFHSEDPEPEAVQRQDGSWLIAGWMPVDEMADQLGIKLESNRDYETAAGLVIARFQRLPETGEVCEIAGWRFEVVDLDGRRIDKILVSRIM
ncbi:MULTISPECIES: hemolysin family protein [unclassified Methylobacterium]|uniref:hemolysin family protein n=1 Tax=unclassified Methylobacterium TaxID=2615210 RepID=UPI0007013925|nr:MULTISPECIES: hemolysin family protein [unclassified Methylobacterium]KQP55158.1 DNA-binding protein [Methylobacterium sp. Leaf108]KQT77869.1 DNA-binding protein [Methylobacterium sp. Leaf466]